MTDREQRAREAGWEVHHGQVCVEAPCCGFLFEIGHEDTDGGWSCPQCSPPPAGRGLERERQLEAELAALRARWGNGAGPDDPNDCPAGNVKDCCGYHEACRETMREPFPEPA